MNPSDYVFREAMRLTYKARDIAMSAAYGQMVLNLLLDEDRSKYGRLEFRMKVFDIRRKLKRQLRQATKLNKAAAKTLARSKKMKREEENGVRRWGTDS